MSEPVEEVRGRGADKSVLIGCSGVPQSTPRVLGLDSELVLTAAVFWHGVLCTVNLMDNYSL